MSDHPYGYWFKCKGCGKPIGFFPDGLPPWYPPGSVGHSKPAHLVGQPGTVPCDLYNRLDGQQLADLHAGCPEIEPPSEMKVVLP